MMLSPFWQIPGDGSDWQLPRVPATRLACSPTVHTSQPHSLVVCGDGSGIEICQELLSIPLLAQEASSPDRNSWMQGLRSGRHLRSSSSGLASGLDQSDSSLFLCHPPRLVDRVLQLWFPLQNHPQRSPTTSVAWSWGTRLTSWWTSLGMMSPGGFVWMAPSPQSALMAAQASMAS